MSRIIEFDVDSATEIEDKKYSVCGRCCWSWSFKNGDIKIGDKFFKAYRPIIKKYVLGLSDELGRIRIEEVRDVKLQVVRIIAYRRDLDELSVGMTGELHLIGEGGDSLKERDYICSSYPDNINSCPLK